MFTLWPKKKSALAHVSGPRFAVMQEDTVVGTFSREQRPNAITVASVIARATGRDTVVYELDGQAIEAELVGKKLDPYAQGWSSVFFAPQNLAYWA